MALGQCSSCLRCAEVAAEQLGIVEWLLRQGREAGLLPQRARQALHPLENTTPLRLLKTPHLRLLKNTTLRLLREFPCLGGKRPQFSAFEF
jgi:hypothetical protein